MRETETSHGGIGEMEMSVKTDTSTGWILDSAELMPFRHVDQPMSHA